MKKRNKENIKKIETKRFSDKFSKLSKYFTSTLKLSLVVTLLFIAALFISAAGVIVEDGALNISNNLLVNSDTLFVDSTNNNVGIGTTSPDSLLDVNGNITSDYITSKRPLFHVRDERASGQAGGTFTAGAWRTRTLNTIKTNEIGASITNSQITLSAGTYFIEASAHGQSVNRHQAKLRQISATAQDTIIGTSAWAHGSNGGGSRSYIKGRFTIADTETFEIQHRSQSSKSSDGFGVASTFGNIEVYAEVMIWKVA